MCRGSAAEGKDTLKLAGEVRANAVPLQVQGTVTAAAPWTTYVALAGQGVSLALHAQDGAAPQISVAGELNAAALDPRVSMLGEVKLDAAWSPGTAHLHAEAAPFTLGSGLRVEQLALDAPALDQPVRARATLTGAARLSLSAETGSPAVMLAGKPLPVAVAAWGQGGTARLQGTLSDPKALRGLDATLSVQIADLAALAPGAPPLRDAALTAHLSGPGGPVPGRRDPESERERAEKRPGRKPGRVLATPPRTARHAPIEAPRRRRAARSPSRAPRARCPHPKSGTSADTNPTPTPHAPHPRHARARGRIARHRR